MIAPDDYVASMREVGIDFESLDDAEIAGGGRCSPCRPARRRRCFQETPAPSSRPRAAPPRCSAWPRGRGDLLGSTAVTRVTDHGSHVVVEAGGTSYTCGAWWSPPTPGPTRCWPGSACEVPLTVTLEQVTYFAPPDPAPFATGRLPVWIWMDEPSYYGFPCYGEATVKAAQDCGGPDGDPDDRGSEPDPEMRERLGVVRGGRASPAAGPGRAHGDAASTR